MKPTKMNIKKYKFNQNIKKKTKKTLNPSNKTLFSMYITCFLI